jgi:hypothetical protein
VYPDVIGFLKKWGWVVEGINRSSVNKNNIIVDQVQFGITREEIKEKFKK